MKEFVRSEATSCEASSFKTCREPQSILDTSRPPHLFSCPCNRVENESRQKKAAAQTKMVKDEDPYGASTDENTDAEAEQDHPIPELPGTPALISASSPVSCLSCSAVTGTNVLRCLSGIEKSDRE